MPDPSLVTGEDVDAVLEGYSLSRIQGFQIGIAAGLAVAAAFFMFFYRIRSQEGDALMEEISWLMPVATLIQASLAAWLWRRDRNFNRVYLGTGVVDPMQVAALGWRSALKCTPTEVCLLLFGASCLLRVGAWAILALTSLAVLAAGTFTSDLMRIPFWWVNASGYLYWWYLFFRNIPNAVRAKRWFQTQLTKGSGTVQVVTVER